MVGQPVASASKISAASNRVMAGATDILADVDAAHAEGCRLAHHVDGEMLVLVPAQRVRRDLLRRERQRHVANRDLILVQSELHPGLALERITCIIGMTNSAPSLTPDGQREVTVLVLV